METPHAELMSRAGIGTESETEAGRSRKADWAQLQDLLRKGGTYWLATVDQDGAPHVVPLFAAWSGSAFYVSANAASRKSRNLTGNDRCVITRDTGDTHLVIEGTARHITDRATLEQAVSTIREVYGWPVTVAGTQLDAPFGAPTSGGPPYEVWEITPTKAFGFPPDGESFAPTRWTFSG